MMRRKSNLINATGSFDLSFEVNAKVSHRIPARTQCDPDDGWDAEGGEIYNMRIELIDSHYPPDVQKAIEDAINKLIDDNDYFRRDIQDGLECDEPDCDES